MASDDRPISAVLRDIADNLQSLVRSEFLLARTELAHELGKTARAGALLGVGVILVIYAVAFLLLAAVYALSTTLPAWAAAVIVGGGIGLIAVVCVVIGLTRMRRVRAVPETVASMKENAEWAKQLAR